MVDNVESDNRISCEGSAGDAAYWVFEPTANAQCYYVRNLLTGRYIQGYAKESGKAVTMGNEGVEYYVAAQTSEGGRYGFACTSVTPHDFSSGTIGLNLRAESNQADCLVQTYAAAAGTNHRSFWKLTLVTPPMEISTSKVYIMSNRNDNNVYIKDNGGDELAMGGLDNTSLWQFEDALR